MRFAIIYAAFWFSIFAGAHLIQMALVVAPPIYQQPFSEAWAVMATLTAFFPAWLIHRERDKA